MRGHLLEQRALATALPEVNAVGMPSPGPAGNKAILPERQGPEIPTLGNPLLCPGLAWSPVAGKRNCAEASPQEQGLGARRPDGGLSLPSCVAALGNLSLFLGFSLTPTLLQSGFAARERYWHQPQTQRGKWEFIVKEQVGSVDGKLPRGKIRGEGNGG